MKSILSHVFFDNTIQSYLQSLALIGGIFLLRSLLSHLLAVIIARVVKTKNPPFNKQRFDALVITPIEFFLMVSASSLGLVGLTFPKYSTSIFITPVFMLLLKP